MADGESVLELRLDSISFFLSFFLFLNLFGCAGS